MNKIDTILKLSGAKSMKEFYSQFPTEDDFMKAHGKAFKKAMRGAKIKKANNGIDLNMQYGFDDDMQDTPLKLEPWMSNNATWKGNPAVNPFPFRGLPFEYKTPSVPNKPKSLDGLNTALSLGSDIVEGIQMIKEQKRQRQGAQQFAGVTDVMRRASEAPKDLVERKYNRPEDMIISDDQLFPTYGKGTNVLAKKGMKIPKAKNGMGLPWDVIGNTGSNLVTAIGGETGGSKIGGSVGKVAGNLIGGPVGGAVGEVVGTIGGTLLDRNAVKAEKFNRAAGHNLSKMGMIAGMENIFSNNNKYMKNGGDISTFKTGGDFKLLEGDVEPLSYNPYSPGSGETARFQGPSHEDGGMKLISGNNDLIEVEGGETITRDTNQNSVVFGNLTAPGYGKSFKNVVADIAKKENKAVKRLKSAEKILQDGYDNPIERLTFNSGVAIELGNSMKLKEYEDEKQELAFIQDAINHTATEMGLSADKLAKGKIQKDRRKGVKTADIGITLPSKKSLEYTDFNTGIKNFNKERTIEDWWGATQPLKPPLVASRPDEPSLIPVDEVVGEEEKGHNWNETMRLISGYMPYFRKSDREGLDPRQVMGEMMALGESEEPVFSQSYQPTLSTPYKMSFQESMNDIVSQTRAAQRLAGDNPAAQAILAGEAYDAINKIKAEEFRINQAHEASVYDQNRKTLDDAYKINLDINDRQYDRQTQAKASTKEIRRKALESISNKYLQNKLEGRTLATYENLYNYRFNPDFRAVNKNPLAQFNMEGSPMSMYSPEVLRLMADEKEREAKNNKGGKNRNGGIIKAFKSL